MPLANGSTFADFTIVRLLGTQSMGEDYLVDSPRLKSRAVLLVLDRAPADPSAPARFERDVERAKTLRQPKIVEVYDSGTFDGRPWVLSEYVSGPDAGALVRMRFPSGMSASGVGVIAGDVAEALDYAAERGVTHGGVSPSTILIADASSMLSGFGLSALRPTGGSDQAALAATAVQLLTGATSFDSSLLPLGATRPELAAVDPVLARAMSDDPREQFASCRDFAAAFARPGDPAREPVAAVGAPVAVGAPARSGVSRTVLSTVLAVIAIAAVVFASVYFIRHRTASDVAAQTGETSAPASASPTALPPPGPPACGVGEALLPQMTERDKLAQLLMVGVKDADDARAVVANDHVGGIMIGSWTDLTMMGQPLKDIAALGSPLPLAVSTDEEGGRVSRLKSMIGVQPSARELVASGQTAEQVYQIALTRGQKMKELGITVDFAPVADVSDQGEDTVIGDRSFSNDPAVVTAYAGAYARGLRDAGVLPVFKHFPGHGHASGDSHLGGVTTPPLDQLKTDDLIPYTTLLKDMPTAAVMVGHMQVPGLTGTDPASLTPAAYRLLRDGTPYGGVPFTGVVFTDDISSMGAINQNYTVAQAALKALQAGADIALWITTDEVPGVLDSLQGAVTTGELKMDQVDQSVLRIAAIKGKLPACGG